VSCARLAKYVQCEHLATVAASGRVKEEVTPLHKDFLPDLNVSLDKYCMYLHCYLRT